MAFITFSQDFQRGVVIVFDNSGSKVVNNSRVRDLVLGCIIILK